MKELHHWLLVYDIRNVKRLVKVEKAMKSFGWRVQKSVFESDADESAIDHLKQILADITHEEDFILFCPVCEKCWQKREKYGKRGADASMTEDFVIL